MLLKLLKVILIIKVLWERSKNGSQLTVEYIDKLYIKIRNNWFYILYILYSFIYFNIYCLLH